MKTIRAAAVHVTPEQLLGLLNRTLEVDPDYNLPVDSTFYHLGERNRAQPLALGSPDDKAEDIYNHRGSGGVTLAIVSDELSEVEEGGLMPKLELRFRERA